MSSAGKDRFDAAAKTVAIFGGIISVISFIWTLQANTEQKRVEFRWKRASLAMELVESMLSDPEAFDALRMIDWSSRDYDVGGGQKLSINFKDVRDSLNVENNHDLPSGGIFVRECFDRLFHHMGRIERALQSELVRFEDVKSPLDYYIPMLRACYGSVLVRYMEQLRANDAMALMNQRFPDLVKCERVPGSGRAPSREAPGRR